MDDLRERVKLLKALQGVSYKEIAGYIELPPKSFYQWLRGYYEFGEDREKHLREIVDLLEE